jgi:hypothetical protein
MRVNFDQIITLAERALLNLGISAETSSIVSKNCAWLEACGYPGIKLLLEAVADERREIDLQPDAMGLNSQNVSCVFLGPAIADHVATHGRVFLRNVRHGLYLLPLSVEANFGIGCPVDPAFAMGGERSKNPYIEKLEIATRDGVNVDDDLWRAMEAN